MAFLALGVFDKVKKMSITDVTKKFKDYYVLTKLLSMLVLRRNNKIQKSLMLFHKNIKNQG